MRILLFVSSVLVSLLVTPGYADSTGNPKVRLNQLGFMPDALKVAVISGFGEKGFSLHNADTEEIVLRAEFSPERTWALSGETVSIADFSSVNITGSYYLEVSGVKSPPFEISKQPYERLHDAVIKAFYFNRAGISLDPQYAGKWARAGGHPDTDVHIHPAADNALHSADARIQAPKGWYDAGDYGKYVVNSGISTYTLLLAYQHFPQFYANRVWNIPESANDVPDLLDEALWNLEWFERMQDPRDGGVYHKLTTKRFSGTVMPADANAVRYVMPKSTSATLNFSAVMAVASRVLGAMSQEHAALAQRYQKAAEKAWKWAEQHPEVYYQQPDDVKTGAYGDQNLADEKVWAAAELFLVTGDPHYLAQFEAFTPAITIPSWSDTSALGYMSLLTAGKDRLTENAYQTIEKQFMRLAETVVLQREASAYGVPMVRADYVWGSNAVALNKAIIAIQGYKLSGQQRYLDTAMALMHYVLGMNPTGYSYVTGFGIRTPMFIHHRPSAADGIANPVPGFVAGGAQPGQQDGCDYPSSLPALSYLDDYCSYSTNEIAINWNAPMVYLSAALLVLANNE